MTHSLAPAMSYTRHFAGLILAAALGSGCADASATASNSAAVVGGAPATGDAAVVALVPRRVRCEDDRPPQVLCTGTLIAPRVVLTAAHCFETFGPQPVYEIFLGDDIHSGTGSFAAVAEVARHPEFDPDTNAWDLALVRLVDPAPIAPLVLEPAALDGAYVGAAARVVGFGRAAFDEASEGIKRTADMVITGVDSQGFVTAPMPGMSCIGDSGGPVFVDIGGVERLAGVTVAGDPGCREYARNLLLNGALDDFITPFVSMTESIAPGYPVGLFGHDAVCEQSCMNDAECPPGLLCLSGLGDGTCLAASTPAGDFAAVCARDAECTEPGATCVRLFSAGADACRCHIPCQQITLPGKNSGCQAGDGHESALLASLLCLALAARRGRRAAKAGAEPGAKRSTLQR